MDGRQHDTIPSGFVPGRYGIDAYGNGGFRFADMSHRGSVLMLPSGIGPGTLRMPAGSILPVSAR